MDGRRMHGRHGIEDDVCEPAWVEGRVPWTVEGLVEAFAEFTAAAGGARGGLSFGGAGTDPAVRYVRWFTERYGQDEGTAHALRFYLARQFIIEHCAELGRAGLLRQVGVPHCSEYGLTGEPGRGAGTFSITVTAGLVRALATLPFSAWTSGDRAGACGEGTARAFDAGEVMAVAKALDARGWPPGRSTPRGEG